MKAALLIVLSLSALAYAGPAFNKNSNQIDQQQAKQYMNNNADAKQTEATETLKQWCFSSQMSQPELTSSFKKLVSLVKSSPADEATEAAVMSERICQGALVQKSSQSGETIGQNGVDAQAHELIKDVYMDALIACENQQCMQQLIKIINSNKVDTIRASYYMTRIAVTERDSIKDETEQLKQLADSFIKHQQQTSEAIERQKLFAVSSWVGKACEEKQDDQQVKQIAEQVAKTIVERYIKPVGQQEVQQYQQQPAEQQSQQVAKKIAKRSAALKALANIPSYVLKQVQGVEETLLQIAQNKQEQSTARQSAIECLELSDSAEKQLKQITFDQEEPIEVRIAAYRAIMASMNPQQRSEQQMTLEQVIKHCESERNQQQDDQFVLYVISHLDNIRTSQQPEHQAIKETLTKNKQHYMQIQVLCKKFKQQLSDVRKSSRNYKLEQEFNQLESGLIIEGDIIYESKNKQQQAEILPKLVRVNMSMPTMGETVNVVEVTLRQSDMDEELLSALKLASSVKFNSESMSKVVDSFKSSVEQQKQQQSGKQQSAEADLAIKVDGCTIVYLCVDDFKSGSSPSSNNQEQRQRNTRSVYSSASIVDDIIEHLKRKPVAFNRGFNLAVNQRLAKVLDIEANVIAGLRFESRASGKSSEDFEISAQVEPRFAFESIVGPAKLSNKKLLQRFSTKTSLGLRLRFKSDELVDVQLDLPMNTMELFNVESQMVERNSAKPHTYSYLPESIYGQEDIYSVYDDIENEEEDDDDTFIGSAQRKMMKRSIFEKKQSSVSKSIGKLMQGKQSSFQHSCETSEEIARATGLRAKLRFAASPKDMSLKAQAIVQKYDSRMQGYRVQVSKQERGNSDKQYTVTVSTPGSVVERSMQVRLFKQSSQQRTLVKAEIQSPKMSASGLLELIHDGRQYAIKTQLQSSQANKQQWRHSLETGVQRGSQSASGRIATSYKPYLSVESTELKRPIQFQGLVSYQQSPKTVITYELKSQTWSKDFVSGKIIVDQRDSLSSKRIGAASQRRSMQSPIERLYKDDLTLTAELLAQISEHAVKVHQMVEWNADKSAVQADLSANHKNLRKNLETEVQMNLKVDEEQQKLTVERRSPQQDQRKSYRFTLVSDCKSPNNHQFQAELRYNTKRQSNQLVAYKHKLDYGKFSPKELQFAYVIDLVATEAQLREQLTGRVQVSRERNSQLFKVEMSSRNKSAKVEVDFASLGEHQIEVQAQDEQKSHRTTVRADKRQFSLQSRTDRKQQMVAKVAVEYQKQADEAQVIVEMPTEATRFVADLKLGSGKLSSIALQTPRFASKGEFTFETAAKHWKSVLPINKLRVKSDLKDMLNKEAYWMESQFDSSPSAKSFLRLDSPVYRTDLEFDPREQRTSFGAFARSKRSINSYQSPYSNDDSILSQFDNKLQLANKLWMLRSAISSSSPKARRALLEYADRVQSHKHTFDYNPTEQRLNFNLHRQPVAGSKQQVSPMRFGADLTTAFSRPSTLSMESEWANCELEAKPFDQEDAYFKVSALSRHPRSPFKKHESEIRYEKQHGFKANMKHQDSNSQRHSLQFEADKAPQKWTKMSYDSDKLGKGHYEHQWRKSPSKRSDSNEQIYANKIAFESQSPRQGEWAHSSQMQWEEPMQFVGRVRRSTGARYGSLDYLKHISARLNSQTSNNQQQLYKVDFEAQPGSSLARLNINMPDDMMHSSSFQYQPTERLYKLQSRMFNQRTNEPHYELTATTKPVFGLGGAEQEPMFVEDDEDSSSQWIARSIFKQPIKFDYTDKYGRQARLDYDESPAVSSIAAALRPKRAAVYYKDQSADFEHQSSYDFYPQSMFASAKKWQQGANKRNTNMPTDFTVKAQTTYGPVVVHVDSDANVAEIKLLSPIVSAKLTSETATGNRQLVKLSLDNKQQQRAQLAKIVRKTPILREIELVEKFAKKFDQGRFEHQTELLISMVEQIFTIKSKTEMNQRPVMVVEGEYNKQQEKAYAKINGERTSGQLMVDLVSKSASLDVDVDNKHTVHHQTRLVRVSDKFFSLESSTSYKQKPIFKLSGKVSSMIFSEPKHLFAGRRAGQQQEEHISTFEAVVYEPKQMQISAQYDCLKKEAYVTIKDVQTSKTQKTTIKFDEDTETVYVDARLSTPNHMIYASQAKINFPGLVQSYKCRHQSCQSEIVYSEDSGNYAAKYAPGEYVSFKTPRGGQTIKLY